MNRDWFTRQWFKNFTFIGKKISRIDKLENDIAILSLSFRVLVSENRTILLKANAWDDVMEFLYIRYHLLALHERYYYEKEEEFIKNVIFDERLPIEYYKTMDEIKIYFREGLTTHELKDYYYALKKKYEDMFATYERRKKEIKSY